MNGAARSRVAQPMRKVIYGGAISLDGFLAGPGEDLSWLRWSDDSAKIAAETFRGVDTMLMGRKTFEAGQRLGGGPQMKGVKTYIFSRTLKSIPERPDYALTSEEVAGFVRRIKGEEGGNILVMGGGELGSALIEAGLVDEIGFSIHPVLLGGGPPAFGPFTHRVELELIEARPIARECVLVRYRVAN
jgi:dihydrofolate reductase